MSESAKEFLSRIGKRGGQAKTQAKLEAIKRNLKLARRNRWPAKPKPALCST